MKDMTVPPVGGLTVGVADAYWQECSSVNTLSRLTVSMLKPNAISVSY